LIVCKNLSEEGISCSRATTVSRSPVMLSQQQVLCKSTLKDPQTMKKWLISAGLLCLFSSLCLSAMAATATFQTISDPVARTWSNYAFSGDGTVMAANYGGEIYRWTAAGGFQDLGPGDPNSSSIGISRDGSTIISGYMGSDGFSRPAL